MKAVQSLQTGDPATVLQFAERPDPRTSDGNLLVRMTARPIQPADLAFIRGQYRIRPELPQIAGLEGTGIVVAAPQASAFPLGTRVAFRAPGSWAELAVVPPSRAMVVPDDVSDPVACQMSLNPTTAVGLLDQAGAAAGDWIVLTAATSAVSNLAGAIAMRRGINVIGVVRGDAQRGMTRCKAMHVVSAEDPALTERIAALAGPARVAAILDSVGGPTVASLFPSLAPGGRIIAYGVMDRAPASVTNAALIYGNLTWMGFGIDRWLSGLNPVRLRLLQDELWAMVRDGTLTFPVAASYDLADFAQAILEDSRPGRHGKVLLR